MTDNITIKHRYTDVVLLEYQPTAEQQASGLAMLAALETAVACGANLRGAYLGGANLDGVNLRGAYLDGAKLDGKKLVGTRPIMMMGPIGSRSDYLTAYVTDAGVFLRAGCFFGSVDKFRAALKDEHGDNEHAQEYAAALALIECHAQLWAPLVETAQPAEVAA